jgi:DNA-directed RNA polymerase III subunit RPC2
MSDEELRKASMPIKDLKDKWLLIPEYLRVKGLVRQHIESYNHFLTHQIAKIIETNNEVKSTVDPQFFVKYVGVRVGTPSMEVQFDEQLVTPNQCRLQDLTYSAPIYVDVHYRRGHKVISKKDVRIGWVPIMLKSNKCILTGKQESELAKLNECPLDPGGYFIVKGNEKVIQIQEQIAHNRLIVEDDGKNGYVATITSNSHAKKSRANCTITALNKIYFKHNTLGSDIPIVIMLKALGATSDLETLQLICPFDTNLQDILASNFEECRDENIETQEQALEWIGKKIRAAKIANEGGRRWTRMGTDPILEAREVISTVVLPHIPAPSFNLREKKIFVALMARKVILAKIDPTNNLDDKDYYGNKQLNLAGFMIALLFEDLLQKFNTSLQIYADKVLAKPNRAEQFDAMKSLREDIITNGFIQSINTGNWNLKRFRLHKQGVTQVLTRLSYISALAHVTKIQSQFEKTRKVSGPRALQPSQWGMLCPSDTPEGETCGLAKNLALLAHITTEVDPIPVIHLGYTLGVVDTSMITGEELYSLGAYMVIVNGRIIGVHTKPTRFANDLRSLRRCGLLDPFVSVQVHSGHRCVYIYCDGGRICRPLLLINPKNGQPLLKQLHIDEIKNKSRDFPSLITEGLVEFLDVSEENDCFIAIDQKTLNNNNVDIFSATTLDALQSTEMHTHMEIDPMTILGVVAGLIPFPHHNQSPRNTYQCAMGKQAIGTIGYNQYSRLDTLLHLMVYPQSPMVKTRVIDLIKFDNLPAGQNAIVAVMSYSGYDIEDAVVLNKASVDRGYGRCIVLKKFMTTLKSYPNSTKDRIREMADGDGSMVLETQKKQLSALEIDGICAVGGTVAPGSTLVRKEMPKNTTDTNIGSHPNESAHELEYIESPLKYKSPEGGPDGVVDKVLITKNKDDTTLIKVLMRQVRRPELGDKFSSRHGQKGVVGIIVPQENMPFNDQGICPDMIMNPHG